MINTADLQRLDRRSVEAKATMFAGVLCLVLWILLGISVKLVMDDWYGFGVGFILSALISALAMWVLYIRPTARKRRVVRASWRGESLRIYDPIDQRTDEIDFSKSHKAILVLSKAERQFLLRLEQQSGETSVRVDIIGQLPMVLPMRPMGEGASLFGFYGKAKKDTAKSKPYRLKEVADRELLSHSLLKFVDSHRATRRNVIQIKKGGEIIQLQDGVFSLIATDRVIDFSNLQNARLLFMARPTHSTETQGRQHQFETAEIFIALVSGEELGNALVFSIIAPRPLYDEYPDSWQIPEAVMQRKFTLYDDSVNSFVVAHALKNLIKVLAPNSPVLDVLRH